MFAFICLFFNAPIYLYIYISNILAYSYFNCPNTQNMLSEHLEHIVRTHWTCCSNTQSILFEHLEHLVRTLGAERWQSAPSVPTWSRATAALIHHDDCHDEASHHEYYDDSTYIMAVLWHHGTIAPRAPKKNEQSFRGNMPQSES